MRLIDKLILMLAKPKNLIIKGCQIDNRAILTLGLNAEYLKDDCGNRVVRFENTGDSVFYLGNCIEVVKTNKRLKWWMQQFKGHPLTFRTFYKSFGRWVLIKD